ncbi:MAG: zeta toxin family protein [Deltaproteobacteria bacterium]|nr:zeta toxin family protein [Deltaproteobacteria bacterium]
MAPNLYIVAGPNGAGKTTFAREFLPNYADCMDFVNADFIADGLSPFSPERAAIRAGRLMLEQIGLFADERRDFGFETTLSGKTYVRLLQDLKDRGYRIHLFFLWLPSVDMALERVADRVRRGGHNIPVEVVRRRFKRGLPNLFQIYRPLLDFWAIIDNSTDMPNLVAFESGKELNIVRSDIFSLIKECMELP